MLSKDRSKTTSDFFVILLFSQFWEEKNYCERRNELSSWRPVTLTNRHIHLCLFKLGYDVHALLSSVMYILSGEKITAVYSIIRRRRDQNTTQVANRLDWAEATYLRLLHISSMISPHQKHYARGPINHRCINSYYNTGEKISQKGNNTGTVLIWTQSLHT
jgi:hypothetical protein